MFSINKAIIAFVTLLNVVVSVHAAIAPRTSPSPWCYVCPPRNKDYNALESQTYSNDKKTVICKYYKENCNKKCYYSRSTGQLTQNSDYHDCKDVAAISTTCPRKRSIEVQRSHHAREGALPSEVRTKLDSRKSLRDSKFASRRAPAEEHAEEEEVDELD